MKSVLCILILALPLSLLAQQPIRKGDRIDDSKIINDTPKAASFMATVDNIAGEPVTTILAPEFQQLEDQYREQLDRLRAQIELARPDEQESLELQAIALKDQLQQERLQTVLTYVRAHGNTEAEARVLEAIEAYDNPVPVQRVQVDRDPVTGEDKKGAAK